MLRSTLSKLTSLLRGPSGAWSTGVTSQLRAARFSHEAPESDEELIEHYETFFDRWDIDGWEVRQAMTELVGMDLVPDPKIIIAALHACRRVNDFALAVRWLEACKDGCGDQVDTIYPYIVKNIRPVLDELGVPTPEEIYYDKPELALKSVYDM